MPRLPVINIQDVARMCDSGRKPFRKLVIGAIKQAETPTPIKPRATANSAKLRDCANATHPATAKRQESQQDAARPESVQCAAHGQLHRGKAEEVGSRQQAEVARTQAQLHAEQGCQCGGHAANQGREKIGQGKAQEYRNRRASRQVGP